jgi:site-specific DNA-methyltransferase (adenine-specific)
MSRIKIINDNALNVFKTIKDNSIDLIITDPPYKTTSRGSSGTMGGYWKSKIAKSGKIFTNNNISCKDYMPELFRVLKDKSILYIMSNNKNLIEMLNEGIKVGFNFVKSLIWNKGNKICGKYYMGCYEYILLFRKGGDRPINDCGTPDILNISIKKSKDIEGNNLHDTEKPKELWKVLIKNSSNEGDLVLDPFCGIANDGIACKELNRDFIGIEIDGTYYNVAIERNKK